MRWPWARTAKSEPAHGGGQDPQPERDISAEFRAAWAHDPDQRTAHPELLPVRLARACVQLLPVEAAGLSLMSDAFRVPLGASNETATVAERLQFTQGEGPCLDAASTGQLSVSGPGDLEQRWPSFARELFTRTPYRSIICLPLALEPDTRVALDLYVEDPVQVESLNLAELSVIGDQIIETLRVARAITGSVRLRQEETEPAWMHGPAAEGRLNVWVGIGMLMTRMGLAAPDALDVLRAYAYSHDTDVDSVAAQLMAGSLQVDHIAQ